MSKFIDLERFNSDGQYERNLVNISHIIRIEKLSKSEDSKIQVHLIDGTILTPSSTYETIRRNIDELIL